MLTFSKGLFSHSTYLVVLVVMMACQLRRRGAICKSQPPAPPGRTDPCPLVSTSLEETDRQRERERWGGTKRERMLICEEIKCQKVNKCRKSRAAYVSYFIFKTYRGCDHPSDECLIVSTM